VGHGQDQGNTPLLLAVEQNYEDMVELLLSKGADATLRDEMGAIALMRASRRGYLSCVKVLLAHHQAATTINLVNSDNEETAIQYATLRGHDGIVRALLDAGGDPTIGDGNNKENFCLELAKLQNHNGCVKLIEVRVEEKRWGTSTINHPLSLTAHEHPFSATARPWFGGEETHMVTFL